MPLIHSTKHWPWELYRIPVTWEISWEERKFFNAVEVYAVFNIRYCPNIAEALLQTPITGHQCYGRSGWEPFVAQNARTASQENTGSQGEIDRQRIRFQQKGEGGSKTPLFHPKSRHSTSLTWSQLCVDKSDRLECSDSLEVDGAVRPAPRSDLTKSPPKVKNHIRFPATA